MYANSFKNDFFWSQQVIAIHAGNGWQDAMTLWRRSTERIVVLHQVSSPACGADKFSDIILAQGSVALH